MNFTKQRTQDTKRPCTCFFSAHQPGTRHSGEGYKGFNFISPSTEQSMFISAPVCLCSTGGQYKRDSGRGKEKENVGEEKGSE